MIVRKEWRKGELVTHTVELVHDCGITGDDWIQEELPF